MNAWGMLGVARLCGIVGVTPAPGDHRSRGPGVHGRWWQGEWQEEVWDGPCEVKLESQRGEFKRAITCQDGVGARWHGEGKHEFREGPGTVTVDATRDESKEEVKCER